MGLLNWQKKPKFEQGDLDYISSVLLGEVKLRVKTTKYIGDINQKIYADTGEAIPRIPHVVYRPSKMERKNWGDCYRACQRLVRCGYLDSFTLRQDGTLNVKFNNPDKIVSGVSNNSVTKLAPVNTYNSQYLQPSIVNELKRFKDTKHDKRVINNVLNPHSKKYVPKRFIPYDFAPPRIEVEARIRQDLKYLHSEEARRYREKQFGAETSCCDKWGEKFKMKGDSYFSRPVLSTPFSQTFKQHCMNRGYCVWPSPIYVTA
jgi:hypothetical protein